MQMPDTAPAAQLVALFEGYRESPYRDVAGNPSIGYGCHFYPNGQAVQMTDRSVSPATALVYLEHDLEKAAAGLWPSVLRQPTLHQWSAMLSLAYNVGVTAVARSTLLKLFNSGDTNEAANQFLLWDRAHVDGQLVEVPGLLNRRKAERQLFLQP